MHRLPTTFGQEPRHHPDCCLAISTPLLETLAKILPSHPSLVISIGSGTGLLEGLLQRSAGDSLNLRGVEVAAGVNKYLPEEDVITVGGTWHLHAGAYNADTWMFVYPREPSLLARYLGRSDSSTCLRKIVWLGPRMDWPDYAAVLASSNFSKISGMDDESVTASYELLCIAERP